MKRTAIVRVIRLKESTWILSWNFSKRKGKLQRSKPFSPDIYKQVAQLIKELSIQKYEGLESDVHNELIQMIILSTKSLIELRTRKLLENSNGNLFFSPFTVHR
jgi:hypothetical protein